MARLIFGEALWTELRRAARKSQSLVAAVAFVGRNPEVVLKWPKRTRLVTAITEERVQRGATSARGVRKLLSLGVDVRSNADLHAKVYVFDRAAFVGSANASESSSRLEEAAVVLSQPAEVAAARAFVNGLWRGATPTDPQILTQLARLEPKWAGTQCAQRRLPSGMRRLRRRFPFLDGRPLWISSVSSGETSALVNRLRGSVARQLVADEEAPSEAVVEWTTLSRKSYRKIPEQDWIYVWWEPSSRSPRGRSEGPLRCLGGIDLGKRADDERYSRTEHAVGSKSFALDSAGVKFLARLTPRLRQFNGSVSLAKHLHDRLGRDALRLAHPSEIRAFARWTSAYHHNAELDTPHEEKESIETERQLSKPSSASRQNPPDIQPPLAARNLASRDGLCRVTCALCKLASHHCKAHKKLASQPPARRQALQPYGNSPPKRNLLSNDRRTLQDHRRCRQLALI